MDSLTQGLLGAATFAVVKDKEIGKKSLLIGAVAGTIPDLDVLFSPFYSDIEFLSVHRGLSHSIILAVFLSLIFGAIFHWIYKRKQSLPKWIFAFFLAIMTHSLLDLCTTYGTKLFSPFCGHMFSTNNIHVFEPMYTSILLIGVLFLLFKNKLKFRRKRIINLTLIISTFYLSWTFVSKGVAGNQFVSAMEKQHIEYEKLKVVPTPLNSILWHCIAKTESGYYFGTYSLFDKRENIEFQFEESSNGIIEKLNENSLVKYYLDYTQDFPLVRLDENGNVEIYAVKFGPINYFGKPEFVYPLSFNLNTLQDANFKIGISEKYSGPVKNYRYLLKRVLGI